MSRLSRRGLLGTAGLIAAAGVWPLRQAAAADPIRIGFSMALTGGLAANGKAALLAIQMWADGVNAKGGLLGRKVELVSYDDQSNPSQVPGLYTKLLDVDKVDLVLSPYGTDLIAPAMPIVMRKGMTMMSLFGVGINNEFRYDRYFQIMPLGPQSDRAIPAPFFDLAKTLSPKPQTIALAGADSQFGKTTVDAARAFAKEQGLRIVYDRAYPPSTVNFTPIVRAIAAAKPDLVFLGSYPVDTVGMVRAAHESGLKTMLFGGGTVGLQFAAIKSQLGPLLNGVLSYEFYVPSTTLKFPGIEEFLQRYHTSALAQGLDPLGFYVPPVVYAAMQVLGDAITRTGSLDQAALAKTMHADTFSTVLGDISFAPNGEWRESRVLLVQYQGVTGNDIDQFRQPGREVILEPAQYTNGTVRIPFDASQH